MRSACKPLKMAAQALGVAMAERLAISLLLLLLLANEGALLASAEGGPCSVEEKVIAVSVPEDLALRLNDPPTQTVRLLLQGDLILDSSIVLNDLYACTILSSTADSHHTVRTSNDSFPALVIVNTSNILVTDVSFELQERDPNSTVRCYLPDCKGRWCPAIYVRKAYGVQIVRAESVVGRIDIIRSSNVSVDSVKLSTIQGDLAGIAVQAVGSGPALRRGNVSVTNNVVTGGVNGVMLFLGAVGVTVANNVFINPWFAGIQCGMGVHNTGDCMLNNLERNLVTAVDGFQALQDAGAIYFDTHWVNPGNYLSCNYVVNYPHCLYLDYASTGVVVDGMVCIDTFAGLKLNAGHSNRVTGFLDLRVLLPGWISCLNYDINNCLLDPGSYWEDRRLRFFNSPDIPLQYAYLDGFCNRTSVAGVDCNPDDGCTPAANVTGACSGIPTANHVEIAVVDARKARYQPYFKDCAEVLPASKLNSLQFASFNHSDVLFNDFDNLDLGLQSSSPLFSTFESFRSCPRNETGPQPVSPDVYASKFNIPVPEQ